MGVCFCCSDSEYSCSYGNWHKIREELSKATILYLEYKKKVLPDTNTYLLENIDKILDIKKETPTYFGHIFFIFDNNPDCKNILISLGVSGIYDLCNKSDDDGYYSVGNSHDILQMIANVRPFLQNNGEHLEYIMKVFQKSVEQKEIIVIF